MRGPVLGLVMSLVALLRSVGCEVPDVSEDPREPTFAAPQVQDGGLVIRNHPDGGQDTGLILLTDDAGGH